VNGARQAMSTTDNPATNAESLSLDHLRAFIAVVETGKQTRAAKRLGVTQTTISRYIKRVEEHFGGGLFETGSSDRLSARGLLLEQSLRTAMAELSRTRERLATDRPVLRIGFIRPVRSLVENALRGQAKVHGLPSFDVRLLELHPEVQAAALARRELDIAISYATPEFATREDIEESLVVEEPFALVIPARAWNDGKPSLSALGPLLYAHSPRRLSSRLMEAEEQWLRANRLAPTRTVECALGSEIVAYAGAGYGYGFLPALWSLASHDGVIFAPVSDFAATAKIAAYSLKHVKPWVVRIRESLSTAARAALHQFRTK
jgi:DNA-binding transcriptional LysR family regulator